MSHQPTQLQRQLLRNKLAFSRSGCVCRAWPRPSTAVQRENKKVNRVKVIGKPQSPSYNGPVVYRRKYLLYLYAVVPRVRRTACDNSNARGSVEDPAAWNYWSGRARLVVTVDGWHCRNPGIDQPDTHAQQLEEKTERPAAIDIIRHLNACTTKSSRRLSRPRNLPAEPFVVLLYRCSIGVFFFCFLFRTKTINLHRTKTDSIL